MKVYISGGAKNGKSTLAQKIAGLCAKYEEVSIGPDGEPTGKKQRAQELPLYYVATMIPTDEEDRMRIARHVSDREGLGFITIERAEDISGIITKEEEVLIKSELTEVVRAMPQEDACCSAHGVFLLDSVTALLANKMFPPSNASAGNDHGVTANGGEIDAGGGDWFNPNSAEEVAEDLKTFIENVDNAIFVSDYIYADPIRRANVNSDEIDYTDTYIRGLAYVDRTIASLCDEVFEVSAGMVI